MKLILYKRLAFSTKRFLSVLSVFMVFISLSSCREKETEKTINKVSELRIIPAPAKVLYKRGQFKLDKSTRILLDLSNDDSKNPGKYLIDAILEKTGYKLKIADRFTTNKINSGIEIILGNFKEIKPEGFKIEILSNRIKIVANDISGVYYASEIIIGIITKNNNTWKAPQVSIEDYPNTTLRGVYLNLDDSLINKPEFIYLLKKNRINYLITRHKWELESTALISIIDTTNKSTNWGKHGVEKTTIKSFYENKNHHRDSILLFINNEASLHPDSIAIVGEAMWSKANKLNYKKLINHLKSRSAH